VSGDGGDSDSATLGYAACREQYSGVGESRDWDGFLMLVVVMTMEVELLLLLLACRRQDDALTNTTHTHPHHPRHAHTQHMLSSLCTLARMDN